ncbi:cytochrome P450 [Actinomadura roseirufa]|uniref:cytochrome P450 n=1 Tax=Actinomadura roseirufa TaxID=2094049 RepID=UPI0010413A4B|nr:cytochrome P450 [Actinomadura roseirufa]
MTSPVHDKPLPLWETNAAESTAVFERLWREYGPMVWVELEPGVNAWLVMGYEELKTVTTSTHLFAQSPEHWGDFANGVVPPDSPLGAVMFPRNSATRADGEEHRRLRAPVVAAIESIDHRRLRRVVQALCTNLMETFAERGKADLVAEYASAVPVLSVGELIGLDPRQSHELLSATQALLGNGEDAYDGNRRLLSLLGSHIELRRARPADDITSVVLNHPDLRNDGEVVESLLLLVAAGNYMTVNWISQALRLMLTDSRFAGRVRGGRLGVDDALDEVLSIAPPMSNVPARYALRDTELGGRLVRRGDAMILGVAGATYDPRAHAGTALRYRTHLAWSLGAHGCPGRDPGRTMTRTAVATALHLLRDVRLAVDPADLQFAVTPWSRGLVSLPVAFTGVGDADE